MQRIVSPTGQRVRQEDSWGFGKFKAPRPGNVLHRGADFVCAPAFPVFSPIDGRLVREARPYVEGDYSGVLIADDEMEIKMFYLLPYEDLLFAAKKGEKVMLSQGEPIGIAQDIRDRLPKITPHIHCEITEEGLRDNKIIRVFKDPESLL